MRLLFAFHVLFLCFAWSANAETLEVTLDVFGRGGEIVRLERRNVFASGLHVQAVTANGLVDVDHRSIKLYRGSLPSDPRSIVVLVQTKAGVIGSVLTDSGHFDVRRGPLASAPYITTRSKAEGTACHVQEDHVPDAVMRLMHEKPVEQTQDAEPLTLQIAIEADYYLFEAYQNREATLAYIAFVIANTSAIYERDFNTSVEVSNVRLFEVPNNPYQDVTKSIGELREQFSLIYQNEMGGVSRDAAMFMTRRGGLGGVAASVGGLCDQISAYCAVDLNGDWFDEVMVSHELGHLCGALHTHNCLWPGGPLDSCVASEYGTCVTDDIRRPTAGTIMSYCHLRAAQGGTVNPVFHARHKQIVRSYLERTACVGAHAARYANTWRGRLIHAGTGQGLSGVPLRLKISVGIVSASPFEIGPDTTCITDEQGAFAFTGLIDGVYSVALPDDYVVQSSSYMETPHHEHVIISADTVIHDIRALPAGGLKIVMHGPVDDRFVAFVRVSDALPEIHDMFIDMGTPTATGANLDMSLREGDYTLIPYVRGLRFTPDRVEVSVGAGSSEPIVLTAESVDSTVGASVVAITTARENGRVRLCKGDTILLTLGNGDSRVATTDKSGVVFFNGLPEFAQYTMHYGFDQQAWVATTDTEVFSEVSVPVPNVFGKRKRDSTVSVADASDAYSKGLTKGLEIFPNPVSDVLTVRGIQPNTSLTIVDALGRVLFDLDTSQPSAQVDVSGFAAGRFTIVASSPTCTLTHALTISR